MHLDACFSLFPGLWFRLLGQENVFSAKEIHFSYPQDIPVLSSAYLFYNPNKTDSWIDYRIQAF